MSFQVQISCVVKSLKYTLIAHERGNILSRQFCPHGQTRVGQILTNKVQSFITYLRGTYFLMNRLKKGVFVTQQFKANVHLLVRNQTVGIPTYLDNRVQTQSVLTD